MDPPKVLVFQDVLVVNFLKQSKHRLADFVFCYLNYQLLKLLNCDETSRICIIVGPKWGESLYLFGRRLQVEEIILAQESIYDDGDEEVEENLGHNDLIAKHESFGDDWHSTAISNAWELHLFNSHVLNTLKL